MRIRRAAISRIIPSAARWYTMRLQILSRKMRTREKAWSLPPWATGLWTCILILTSGITATAFSPDSWRMRACSSFRKNTVWSRFPWRITSSRRRRSVSTSRLWLQPRGKRESGSASWAILCTGNTAASM